jgi:two-component system phosphate regulon sensor histidine kinase PhoR
VLANLIHNSIKFTPPGGQVEVQAFVTRRQRDDDTALPEQVAVSVADSGVGIPPDDLDRIFERFFKTDRSRATGGTGLGLAISKHLVHAHGGRIWAESDGPGRGSTFTFTLPLARSTGAPDEPSWPRQAVLPEAVGAGWPRS